MSIIGKIHSVETGSAVDGPGIRYVAFLQGCMLRCKYCHNPDSWNVKSGRNITSDELISDILRYKSFITDGGVTLTGGEPLLQSAFVEDVFKKCHNNGLHTALDTSGNIKPDTAAKVLDLTDLLLLDVKSADKGMYEKITGGKFELLVDFIEYAYEKRIPMWIRHVVVPTLTADESMIELLGDFLEKYRDNIEKTELLSFHKLGEYKWEKMRYKYDLYDVPVPEIEEMKKYAEILRKKGLKVSVK